MNIKIGITGLLLFLVSIFIAQNYQVVTVKFFFWSCSASRSLIIGAAVLAGFCLGLIVSAFKRKQSA